MQVEAVRAAVEEEAAEVAAVAVAGAATAGEVMVVAALEPVTRVEASLAVEKMEAKAAEAAAAAGHCLA